MPLEGSVLADIAAAHAHLSRTAGDTVADEWRDGLYDALASLATLPERRLLAQENRRFGREVRQLVYRRRPGTVAYRVLFTLFETEGEAPTVRVLHVFTTDAAERAALVESGMWDEGMLAYLPGA